MEFSRKVENKLLQINLQRKLIFFCTVLEKSRTKLCKAEGNRLKRQKLKTKIIAY